MLSIHIAKYVEMFKEVKNYMGGKYKIGRNYTEVD